MSAVITGKNYVVTNMDSYNKYQTKHYPHAHISTLHTQQMVASTWLGDHLRKPSAPRNSLHKLQMARYQLQIVIFTGPTAAWQDMCFQHK